MSIYQHIQDTLARPTKRWPPTSPGHADAPDPDTLQFGTACLPESEATTHFLLVATTGGAKTTLIRLLSQSIVRRIRVGTDARMLYYDAKQDALPLLRGIAPDARIVTSNPFDLRGARWDLCRDIVEPRTALELAFTLIPREHESQPFFADAARHLTYSVIVSFLLTGQPWTFADLIRVLRDPRRIKAVLRKHPQTRDVVRQYFYDERLVMNIMSTLATKMLAYEPIAACWENATETFSLEDWIKQEWLLVLANSETSRAAIDAINRCIFKRASDLLLSQDETWTRRTWVILDELSEAGKLDGLVSLLKKGRSKGVAAVLAFQSVSGLRDPKMYGQYFADEILGQIGNRFIGRLECPTTAEWASQLFGEQEAEVESRTRTTSQQGTSNASTRQLTTRKAVLPAEFMALPPCNARDGVTGFYLIRSIGAFSATIPGKELFGNMLTPPDPNVPGFIPRPVHDQFLKPWSKEDQLKFCRCPSRPGKKPGPKPSANGNGREQAHEWDAHLKDLDDLVS